MAFAAYDGRGRGMKTAYENRDNAAGILGTFHPGEDQPIATADTLDQLEREARAYLGSEPSALLYLTDADYRVRRILVNEKYHEETRKAKQKAVKAIIVLVFCFTCLVGASLGSLGIWPLVAFVGALALYALFIISELLNEIEAAIPTELLLILCIIIIPMFLRARVYAREHRERGSAVGSASLHRQDLPGTAAEVPRTSAATVKN
ncbi:MAG: hypothetical protein JWL77_2705 [Chthonomonadaceae bacterium]|nr:hypothetical protein [Chthonomonadaceae bacterium]